MANFRFSKLMRSRGLWFQAKSTASWKVVTSRSYWPTSFLKVIWNTPQVKRERADLPPAALKEKAGTHDAVGHQVMPVQLPAAVVLLVEILHLWNEVFQLCGEGDKDLLAAPRPRPRIQDLDVDGVG